MKKTLFNLSIILVLSFGLILTPVSADEELDYPTDSIEMIVSFAAGGGTDVNARILADVAEDYVGENITVVNRAGGGGTIGFSMLGAAEPDGYTIGFINVPAMNIAGHMQEVPYVAEDFQPIIQLVEDPGILLVQAGGEFENLEDFMEAARERSLSVSTSGAGTDVHLSVEAISLTSDLNLNPSHYDGASEANVAVMGGHVDATIAKVSEAVGPVENGEMIPIALLTEERVEEFSEVPTLLEHGIDVQTASSRGIAVPADTPREIVDYLHEKLKEATEDERYIEAMEDAGLNMVYRGPDDFQEFFMNQDRMYEEVVEELDLGN